LNTQFKCAIFDLDGTLVNTIDDLGLATDYVLEQYGRTPKWTQADYKKLVGNGAKKLVERAFEHQLSPEQLEEAYAMFKVKYNAVKMDHAHAYPGIQAALEDQGHSPGCCHQQTGGSCPGYGGADLWQRLF